MMDGEELGQSKRWKRPFGGFFRKRFNGFIVNIWLILQMDNWRIKLKNYDTTTTTLNALH
jgi:hypothetical protein